MPELPLDRRLPERPGHSRRPARRRDRADEALGPGGRAGGRAGRWSTPTSRGSCWRTWSSSRRGGRRGAARTVLDDGHRPLSRAGRSSCGRTDDPGPRGRGRGLGALPPARARECRRSAPSGSSSAPGPNAVDLLPGRRPAAARGRAAVRPLVDRRPAVRRSPLPRPGRRMHPADPRPARPRAPTRRPSGSGSTPRSARTPATPPGSA